MYVHGIINYYKIWLINSATNVILLSSLNFHSFYSDFLLDGGREYMYAQLIWLDLSFTSKLEALDH